MNTSRMRPSPATVIALVALFVALVNTAVGQVDRRAPTPIPPKSIGAKQLKPNAVVASKIKPSAVTTEKIQPEAIDTTLIKAAAITTAKIKPEAIDSTLIPPAAIGPAQIAPEAVTAAKIKSETIDSAHIKGRAITTAKIQPEAIDSTLIPPNAIGPAQLAPEAVTAAKIKGAAITAAALAPNAVTPPSIAANAITPPALAPNAVTPPSIAPTAVTAAAIQPNAVSATQLANESVGVAQLSTAIPSASARSTTSTCRDDGAYTANHYTSELFDTASMFPGGGGADYRLTAPIKGIYQVTASQVWAGDGSGGTRSIEFNGREADNATPFGPLGYSTVPAVSGGAAETPQTLTGTYQLDAGQSIEVWTGASGLSGSSSGCPGGATSTSFGNTGPRASTFTMTFLNPVP